MDIDFHHGVTYLVARLSGFTHREAEIIAHSAQYVDDATNDGVIPFRNGAMYRRCATAHRTLDYKNFAALSKWQVWIPFHFLPGNGGLPASRDPGDHFVEKLIVCPNSQVAQDMNRQAILERNRPYALHRLGITAHVFVDTYAHMGFAGVNHVHNRVSDVQRDGKDDAGFQEKLVRFLNGYYHQTVPPLGHGMAMSYPDRPYLNWSYRNGRGIMIERDNAQLFAEAADGMAKLFQRFLAGNPDAEVPGLEAQDRHRLEQVFRSIEDPDGHRRHVRWLQLLADDEFGIGPVGLNYVAKGEGSWKHLALGTTKDADGPDDVFDYRDEFLTSDYKMFHDAAKAHRRAVVDDILPQYGICVA